MTRSRRAVYIVILPFFFLITACKTSQYLKEGQRYYSGGEIRLEGVKSKKVRKQLLQDLEEVNSPKPNTTVLGMRIGLWAHQKVKNKEAGILAKQINKRFGEEPVYFNSVDPQGIVKLFENRLELNGFFSPQISVQQKEQKNQAHYRFTIKTEEQLIVDSINYAGYNDSLFSASVRAYINDYSIENLPFPFQYDRLKQIRKSISEILLNKGYFYFDPSYFRFQVDSSSLAENKVILSMQLKDDTPEKSLRQYRVNKFSIYPNNKPLEEDYLENVDTTQYADISFIQDGLFFRPDRMYPYIFLHEEELITNYRERSTRRRLNSLDLYKFINIRYEEVSEKDSAAGYLNTSIFLTPYPKRSIRTELEVISKSNNFVGPVFRTEYLNRNLFRGGENLKLSGKIGYELQLIGREFSGLNSLEAGISTELEFPRVLLPFNLGFYVRNSVPTTSLKLSYDLLNRSQWFQLNSFLASLSYDWKPNSLVSHSLTPLSVNYIGVSNQTVQFDSLIENSFTIQNTFREQFILGGSYSFEYNQLSLTDKSNRFYFLFNTDFSGNILSGLQSLTQENNGDNRLFGQRYAQFSRLNFDLRNYQDLGEKSSLVSRLFVGIGLPYGNSRTLPYAKQYSAGGPNSIRAFRIRSLGPGNYRIAQSGNNDVQANFFDRTGDIKLESNIEYRFPIISYLKGAVFTDLGNIWLRNATVEEGGFTKNWINQIAIGSGIGLRLDIDFFVIRLDVATPVRKPTAEGFRWQNSFRLFDSSWRSDNLVWNFGLGYPF